MATHTRRKSGQTICFWEGCTNPPGGKRGRFCEQHRSQLIHDNLFHKQTRYKITPEIDQMIIESWHSSGHGKSACLYVEERTGWPKWKIRDRAIQLGVQRPRKKSPPWSQQELETLEKYAWMNITAIQRKLKRDCGVWRSADAVKTRRCLLKLPQSVDGYNPRQLAELLGCDSNMTLRWIRSGLLPAKDRDLAVDSKVNHWFIPHEWVYQFVLKHPEYIDLCNVNKMWFLNLLTRGKIGLEQLR